MNLSRARTIFFAESRELCDALESALLDRDLYPATRDTFDLLFRTAHTIKGTAGVFGFDTLVRFAHVMENVLERLRAGQIPLEYELITLLLQCNDHLRKLLDIGESEVALAPDDLAEAAPLLDQLRHYQENEEIAAELPVKNGSAQAQSVATATQQGSGTSSYWQLTLRFHPDTFRMGFDPLSFISYLSRLGTLRHVETVWRAWPTLADLDPAECFFGLEIALESDADGERIGDTFEFISDDSLIGILPPHAALTDYRILAQQLKEKTGESMDVQIRRWQSRNALTEAEAVLLLSAPQEPMIEPTATMQVPILPSPIRNDSHPDDKLKAALPSASHRRHSESQYVRIEADKLDRLINRVGELVIAASGTSTLVQQRQDAELMESVEIINSLVESIRDDALTLRMVPIGETFGCFPRMVRETAHQLGKTIRLDIQGAETEIDKSMVEMLADPLMHIVRNALDHGIELPECRRLAGKPEEGMVMLSAYHDAGAVVIEIRDDGKGINREKVLAKAMQHGLLQEGRVLTDQETLQLIFLPGFSTAEAVSDLSGRGVGMDVVKRSIEALRGVIDINSSVGTGTVFRLRLPLTLAIIDGFRVEVDGATLVMPLDMMYECVEMPVESMHQNAKQINVRGEWLPFVSLRDMFGLPIATAPEYVVIVYFGNSRAGIVVDRLLGEVQAVIKPLGEIFKSLRGISGSTILGNGHPALVLDIPQLIEHALRTERRRLQISGNPVIPAVVEH